MADTPISTQASTTAKVIAAALSWVGTPYHLQQRCKGVGVDCAHLVAGIAIDAGIIPPDTVLPTDYSSEWNLHNSDEKLLQHLEEFGCKRKDKAQPGDIICFTIGKAVGHLGIMISDTQYVHAQNYTQPYRVVINTLSGKWAKRHTHTYSFPGA